MGGRHGFEQIGLDCKVTLIGIGGNEFFGNHAKWKGFEGGTDYLSLIKEVGLNHWAPHMRRHHAKIYPFGHYYYRYFLDAAKNEIIFRDSPEGAPNQALLQSLWERSGTTSYNDAVSSMDFQLPLPEEFLLVMDSLHVPDLV